MMRRLTAALAATTALLLLAACGSPDAPTAPPAPWTGAILQHPTSKPDIELTDTSGRPFNIATDTTGKVALVYFGYTNCPDRCPTDMAAVANAMKQLSPDERGHVRVVFVTTDPQRDTGPALRTFLDRFDKSFIGLTGSAGDILRVQRDAGITPATTATPLPTGYTVDHAAYVLVYSADGRAHEAFPGGMTVNNEAADLHRLAAGDTPASA